MLACSSLQELHTKRPVTSWANAVSWTPTVTFGSGSSRGRVPTIVMLSYSPGSPNAGAGGVCTHRRSLIRCRTGLALHSTVRRLHPAEPTYILRITDFPCDGSADGPSRRERPRPS